MKSSSLSNRGLTGNSSRYPTSMPPQKYYTVLSVEPQAPFGFGSSAPARPEPKISDTPGPGMYDSSPKFSHWETADLPELGFGTTTRRRLAFVKGNKNPAPSSYSPTYYDHRIKTSIGTIPKGKRTSCFPDERESSTTPGPGSYNIPSLKGRATTSVFKSKMPRVTFQSAPQKRSCLQGNTLVIKRYE